MPSARRVKVLGLVVALVVFSILYLTSSVRQSSQEFHDRTVKGMDDKAAAARVSSDQEVMQKLEKVASQVEQGVKSQANSRKPPEVVLQEGDNSMPRLKGGEKWDVSTGKESAVGEKEPEIPKTNEEKDVESELNSLLKRSPIIIFSKSYCPYSKRAKATFEKYTIIPEPFIVELDEHRFGHQLQDALEKNTGRGTVPNILISGKSIGGGDEVAVLHESGALIEKIKYMGGKRIMEAKLKEL